MKMYGMVLGNQFEEISKWSIITNGSQASPYPIDEEEF